MISNTEKSTVNARSWQVLTELGESFHIAGHVAPGYEVVQAAFEENFRSGSEIGAACAAFVDGQCVVDLWGGRRGPDSDELWERDTLTLLMSTTKGLSAMAVALCHARGYFNYDDAVAKYWPEFAQHGKQDISIRQLLAHQAGLPAVDSMLSPSNLADLDALAVCLADQHPAWPAGERHGYHAVSLGHFQSELIRRTDPQKRSLGQFFHDEIALPMGGDMYIGLPEEIADARMAKIRSEPSWAAIRKLPIRSFLSLLNPFGLAARSTRSPKFGKLEKLATREFLRFELPSIGGVATARAVAKTYAAFAGLDTAIGLDEKTLAQLTAPAVMPQKGVTDALLGVPIAFSLGFSKPFPMFPFGSDTKAFGAAGVGGSQGFADPSTGLAFAYTPNRFVTGGLDDPRAVNLRNAIYHSLNNKGKDNE